jgi:hypothetical protein
LFDDNTNLDNNNNNNNNNIKSLDQLFDNIITTIVNYLKENYNQNPKFVGRIFLLSFHEILFKYFSSSQQQQQQQQQPSTDFHNLLAKFFQALRHLISGTRTIITLTLPTTSLSTTYLTSLHILVDTILIIESFAGQQHRIPIEFREFIGFFIIKKLNQQGVLTTPPPKASKYGLKRDRRKLYIEMLHLPPEESRAMASSSCSSSSSANNSNNSNGHANDQTHNHNHTHQHQQSIGSGRQHITISLDSSSSSSSSSVTTQLTTTPESTTVSSSLAITDNNDTVTNTLATTTNPPGPLAAKFALARAQREAGKSGNTTTTTTTTTTTEGENEAIDVSTFKPISISRSSFTFKKKTTASSSTNESLDF